MNRAKSSTQTFSGALRTARRVVDHQGLVLDPLEQVGRGDVAEVERRILPHEDDIDVAAEVEDLNAPSGNGRPATGWTLTSCAPA